MGTVPAFRFVDLFAGVGGFHAALKSYGGECVYAVEIDKAAAAVYKRNWGHDPLGDITKDADEDVMNVPAHEVLAAGFPCQPFSKSGAQRGMDETRGTLFWNIAQIIKQRKPKVVLLENVRNLAGPRHLHEWQVIIETLRDEGYRVSEVPAIFSPHLLPPDRGGRPQVRERVFITATSQPEGSRRRRTCPPGRSAGRRDRRLGPEGRVAPGGPAGRRAQHSWLRPERQPSGSWIDAWDEWVQIWYEATDGRRPPGFPIWADAWTDYDQVVRTFGCVPDLPRPDGVRPGPADVEGGPPREELRPVRRGTASGSTPGRRSGTSTRTFPPSRRKLEWQAQDTPRLWDTVMHFRPSGIRAKRADLPSGARRDHADVDHRAAGAPSVAARDGTAAGPARQVRLRRPAPAATYKQMGNGVNVGVVWHVMREHVRRDEDVLKRTAAGKRILQAVFEAPVSPDEILARHAPAAEV